MIVSIALAIARLPIICFVASSHTMFLEGGYDTIIAEDGASAFTKKDHVFRLKHMKENYGATIKKTSQIITDINKQINL
jgi:hypothetical protein